MSGTSRLPHWWNRISAKTKRNYAFSLKTSFVKLTIAFSILFMWIRITDATEVPPKKQKFEWMQFDENPAESDSQSLKFCILNERAISGWSERNNNKRGKYGIISKDIPILCRQTETRYRIIGLRWSSSNLTYKILSYPRRTAMLGGYANIDREFKNAFTLWESVSDFRFTAIKDRFEADINIRFVSRDLAVDHYLKNWYGHTIHSDYGGDIHFNDDVEWAIGTFLGPDIFQIAVHEVGHALGLGHYLRNGSVMCTAVCKTHVYRSNFTVHSDDIEAIQLLYGKKSLTTYHKQEQTSLLELLITWAAIAMACIILGVIIAVGVIQIIRCRKKVSEHYWTKVEFGVSLE